MQKKNPDNTQVKDATDPIAYLSAPAIVIVDFPGGGADMNQNSARTVSTAMSATNSPVGSGDFKDTITGARRCTSLLRTKGTTT